MGYTLLSCLRSYSCRNIRDDDNYGDLTFLIRLMFSGIAAGQAMYFV